MRNRHRYLGLGIVIALIALAAAGCGGGGGSPGVANLGATGTTTDPSSVGAPSGSAPSSPPNAGMGQAMMIGGGNALKFSQCMRAHGVKNFPDPNSQGAIQISPDSGIDSGTAVFRSAAQACQKNIGGGKGPQLTPAQQARAKRQALAFSACMRKHGVPDFPDPNFSGGHVSISIHANPSSDLNPNSPTFQAAQQACQGLLPFKGAKTSSSGGAK